MNQHAVLGGRARGLAIVGALCAMAVGCARDVSAHYPAPATPAAGEIEIAMTTAAYNVEVAVDGNLVARDRHTQRMVIDRVPPGPHLVQIAMGGDGYTPTQHTASVVVQPAGRASVVVAAPEISAATSIRIGAAYVGWMIGLVALAALAP
jgi:hypothetical protein